MFNELSKMTEPETETAEPGDLGQEMAKLLAEVDNLTTRGAPEPESAPEPSPSPPWLQEARPPATPAAPARKRRKKLKITIGTPTTGLICSEYVTSLTLTLLRGKYIFKHLLLSGSVIHNSRNSIAASFDNDSDYLLFIDSDMVWHPEDIDLLVAADVDIVAGLAYGRGYPFRPTIFNSDFSLPTLPHPLQPFQVSMCGAAFMLIRPHVFQVFSVARKWIGLPFDPLPHGLGQFSSRSDLNYEDLSFCLRARKLGFEVWVEPRVDLGHVGKQVHSTKNYLAQGFLGFRLPPLDDLTGMAPPIDEPKQRPKHRR